MTTSDLQPLPKTPAVSGVLEALSFFNDPNFATSRFERYGDVYETVLFGQSQVFVRGERAISDLFAQADRLEGWWPGSVRELLGPFSLANRHGPAHKARRRVVGQLFSAAAIQRYTPSITALVDELCADLAAAPAPVALAGHIRRFAFAVIASTVLGLNAEEREALFVDFEIWTKGLFALPLPFPWNALPRARATRQRLLKRLADVLRQAQARAASGESLGAGGLDLLAGGLDEAGLPLADDDVVEQLLLLLFAGYETTASSLTCLMLALLQHPEQLAWLRQELDTLAWPPNPQRGAASYDAAGAPRLDAMVREVMRLTPPVGGFFRRTLAEIQLAGFAVPADRVVQVSLRDTHRLGDPDDDLDVFRPQRHLEDGCSALLLPFGGGERVCLGKALAEAEIRLLAVGLLQRIDCELMPAQDLSLAIIPSPTPKSGLQVQASRRSEAPLVQAGPSSTKE